MALHRHNSVALTQNALDQIYQALHLQPAPAFVGVIDIGTGNLNVVFDANGNPYLYCDLGGGALGSTFTFPDHLQLCTRQPPSAPLVPPKIILLTHFDQDHWRFALNANGAIAAQASACTWLVPHQARGPRQIGFFKALCAATTVHERPTLDPNVALTIGARTEIVKCTGRDANNSGLALKLEDAAGQNWMLLPGDAYFRFFDHDADDHVAAIVASHHGAEPRDVPPADAANLPRPSAFSFGWGNAYGFPRMEAEAAYEAEGYTAARRMDNGGAEGAADVSGPRGNISLLWPGDRGPGWLATFPLIVAQNVSAAAMAVLAAATAAVRAELGGLNLVQGESSVACAAAYMAMRYLHAAGDAADRFTQADLFGVNPQNMSARLTAADAVRTATAAFIDGNPLALPPQNDQRPVMQQIAGVMASAHGELARTASHAAWNAWGFGGSIQRASSPARVSAVDAMRRNGTGRATAQLLVQALTNGGTPLENVLQALAVPALGKAAQRAHSLPGRPSQRPPAVAGFVATMLRKPKYNGAGSNAECAAIAAAAAMQPGIATNPEAPSNIPPLGGAELVALRNRMAVAIAAAFTGVEQGMPEADAARAAVAGAMSAIGTALGAQQPGCHRYPATCPNLCQLTMHYVSPQ